jgi:hypothetical protein
MHTPLSPHDSRRQNFNPLDHLQQALESGVAIWDKINSHQLSNLGPLLGLTFLLEEHIETLTTLCMLKGILQNTSCEIIERLKSFYQGPEIQLHSSKRGPSLFQTIRKTAKSPDFLPNANYFAILAEQSSLDDEVPQETTTMEGDHRSP